MAAANQAPQPPQPQPLLGNRPPLLQLPPRPGAAPIPPPGSPQTPVHIPPDGNLGADIDPGYFKVVIMRCTAGVHEGAASVTLDRRQGLWSALPNEFVISALRAASMCPIQNLILRNHCLSTLPANFASPSTKLITSLITLDLHSNCFTSLPSPVCQLSELKELYLTQNKLTTLPKELANLKQLRILHLQNNRLTDLPVCVCQLASLEILNIECNIIETIPDEVCHLYRLKELYAKSNRLETVPSSIAKLSSLLELHLADNVLKSLPQHLDGLSSLKQLHLANNQLQFLPYSLTKLTQLSGISLSGNSLKYPPLSACRGGVASLQAYMRNKAEKRDKYAVTENPYYDDDDSSDDTPYEDL